MDERAAVAIVTDSAASIPATLLEQYRIEVVPFWVHMGREAYRAGVDLRSVEFFRRLRAAPDMEVKTGVPAIPVFTELYERQATWAKAIVSIHIAGQQSGTCNAARLAGQAVAPPVVVVDSQTTAMGEGFVALRAARLAAEGATLEQVVAGAEAAASTSGVIALLETIKYAFQGGRLSGAASRVGSLLNIQPLVRVQGNRVSLAGQARRRSKGVAALIDKVVSEVGEFPVHLAVHYAEDQAEGTYVLEALKQRLHCVEAYLLRVPIALGVHAGPGAVGVAYSVEKETTPGLAERLEKLAEQAKEAIRSRLE